MALASVFIDLADLAENTHGGYMAMFFLLKTTYIWYLYVLLYWR